LDKRYASDVTLIATGELRLPEDFVKALCLGAQMCHTNNCPAGIATQKPELRSCLKVDVAAERLEHFFGSSVELMKLLARACGHSDLGSFPKRDITTWKKGHGRSHWDRIRRLRFVALNTLLRATTRLGFERPHSPIMKTASLLPSRSRKYPK